MIKLDVESYCQECEEFEPRAFSSFGYWDDKKELRTIINCRHREKCKAIYEIAVARAREEAENE